MKLLQKKGLPSKPVPINEVQVNRQVADLQTKLFKAKVELEQFGEEAEKKKATIQADLDLFIANSLETQAALTSRVEELERRKENALLPLIDRERACVTREEELTLREQQILNDMQKVSLDRQAIIGRQEEIDRAKDTLQVTQEEATRTLQGAQRQADLVDQSTKALNDKWIEFHTVSTDYQAKVIEDRNEIASAKELISKERSVLVDREKAIKKQERSLGVREQALKQAFDEARKKNLL